MLGRLNSQTGFKLLVKVPDRHAGHGATPLINDCILIIDCKWSNMPIHQASEQRNMETMAESESRTR
jgi:hypothetical protein